MAMSVAQSGGTGVGGPRKPGITSSEVTVRPEFLPEAQRRMSRRLLQLLDGPLLPSSKPSITGQFLQEIPLLWSNASLPPPCKDSGDYAGPTQITQGNLKTLKASTKSLLP